MSKVFISWSGSRGRRLAEAMKETILDGLDVWISSQDIALGSSWFESIDTQLKKADCALVCLTPDAVNSAWIYFESGALWVRLRNVKVILLGVALSELKSSPFSQLQLAQGFRRDDMARLLLELFDEAQGEFVKRHLDRTWNEWLRRVDDITPASDGGDAVGETTASLRDAVIRALRSQSRHFRAFDLKIDSQLTKPELERLGLPFDLSINGFLKMRADLPRRVRTAYDVSLLFEIIPGQITNSCIDEVVKAGERILSLGLQTPDHGHFDPWDTYLFLAGPSFDETITTRQQTPYVNTFVLSFDGRYCNVSPHVWMDAVLDIVCNTWNPPVDEQ